jgi:hypothetical protein
MEPIVSQVEIHFYDQDKASIFLETGATGYQEIYVELALFTMFLVRVLSNISGTDASEAAVLALEDLSPFLDNPGLMPDLAHLVLYPGHPGRKRFSCRVVMKDEGYKYSFSQKGFGFLGRGLPGYSIEACFLLALYLTRRRDGDGLFSSMLCHVAQLCSRFSAMKAIKVSNHYQIGTAVMTEALAPLSRGLGYA